MHPFSFSIITLLSWKQKQKLPSFFILIIFIRKESVELLAPFFILVLEETCSPFSSPPLSSSALSPPFVFLFLRLLITIIIMIIIMLCSWWWKLGIDEEERGRKKRNERGKKSDLFFFHSFSKAWIHKQHLYSSLTSFSLSNLICFSPLSLVCCRCTVFPTHNLNSWTQKRGKREKSGGEEIEKERKIEKSPTSHFNFIKWIQVRNVFYMRRGSFFYPVLLFWDSGCSRFAKVLKLLLSTLVVRLNRLDQMKDARNEMDEESEEMRIFPLCSSPSSSFLHSYPEMSVLFECRSWSDPDTIPFSLGPLETFLPIFPFLSPLFLGLRNGTLLSFTVIIRLHFWFSPLWKDS